MIRGAAAAALLVGLGGCGGHTEVSHEPTRTVAKLRAALLADDPGAAYALLHPGLKRELPLETFSERWHNLRAERQELAERLGTTNATEVTHARMDVGAHDRIVLVREDGGYRVAGGVLDARALETPLDAVAEFRRALATRDLDLLLSVLSREQRAGWLSSFEASVEETSDPLDLEVELRGDEAVVRTTGGGELLLRREAGKWRVARVRHAH